MNHTEEFYDNLYTSQNVEEQIINNYLEDFNPTQITNNQAEQLNKYITEEEVYTAINLLEINKSPGIDGLKPEFYQKFKTILAPVLALTFNILMQNYLTKSMTLGLITLLYKN